MADGCRDRGAQRLYIARLVDRFLCHRRRAHGTQIIDRPEQQDSLARRFFRTLLALLYLLAGIAHIRSPGGFLQITPDWVPFPEQVILLTGVAEIAGAIGLMIPPRRIPHVRYAAGIGLALYALCVYPANINHALNNLAIGGATATWIYHGPRLAFQPVFIWWALIAGGVTNWPFGHKQP